VRILLIGPDHDAGSVPPYLAVLANGLRAQGATVDRLGSRTTPVDDRGAFWPAERIVAAADALLAGVDLCAYDLLSIHFGNNEIEQLLPVRWAGRPRPPAVHHVESLGWTLFSTQVVNRPLWEAVVNGVYQMDGLIYFGSYARQALATTPAAGVPSEVAFMPTTIPDQATTAAPTSLPAALRELSVHDGRVRATLYGFASPWKDVPRLLAAFRRMRVRLRFTLLGPSWDAPRHAGVDLAAAVHPRHRRWGPVEVTVAPGYLAAHQRLALVEATDLAVLPYREHPGFQGSGVVADYLARGVPVVATDVANMRELVGDAGVIVPPGDPAALASTLDRVAGNPDVLARLRAAARRRAALFSPATHARRSLALYRRVAQGLR
jgi:glycosyltransferase involved in cell wall biosynthesis